MAAAELTGAAWRFALNVYGKPDVAPACLRLQDEGGVDVVLLLVVGYAARCGVRLDQAALDRLDDQTAMWRRQVVQPLREVRRALKQGDPAEPALALRGTVQAAELEAERIQLSALIGYLPEMAPAIVVGPVLTALQPLVSRNGVAASFLLPLLAKVAVAMDETPV